MKQTSKKLNALSILFAAPALLLAQACGDSSEDSSSGTNTAANTAATTVANTAGTNPTNGTNPTTGPNTGGPTGGTPSGGDTTGNQPGKVCAKIGETAKYENVPNALTGNVNWTCDKVYVLSARTDMKGGILNVEPGTTILGQNNSALVIEKDAQLQANGTADKPIVFTSAQPAGSRERGDWGGIVFLGKAPTNAGVDLPAEGFNVAPTYGGNDPAHNCGSLKYVRVEFAGFALKTDKELNAITFYACGSGTKMEYVQSHMGLDDGIEWFGGRFDAHHIVVTGAAADSLDVDQGFEGKLQHVFIQQDPNIGDNLFEISNNEAAAEATPFTHPHFANLTAVGSGNGKNAKSFAITLKDGKANISLYNSVLTNTTRAAMTIKSLGAQQQCQADVSKIQGTYINHAVAANPLFQTALDLGETTTVTWKGTDIDAWLKNATYANKIGVDPALTSLNWGAPNIKPTAASGLAAGAVNLPAGMFPDAAAYIGAVDPAAAAVDWTKGWTSYATN